MLDSISGFLSGLKQLTPVLILGVALPTGILLFAPEGLTANLGLQEFRQTYRPQIGGTFLISLGLLLSHFVFWLGAQLKSFREDRSKRNKAAAALLARQQSLHQLTPDEKAYLVPYIVEDVNTQYFQIEDGVAGGLVGKSIIYQASRIGSILDGLAYNIQPWARDYLKENPQLLEGANPAPEGPPRW